MAYGGPSSSGMIVCIYFIILFICGNCILCVCWKRLHVGLRARDTGRVSLEGSKLQWTCKRFVHTLSPLNRLVCAHLFRHEWDTSDLRVRLHPLSSFSGKTAVFYLLVSVWHLSLRKCSLISVRSSSFVLLPLDVALLILTRSDSGASGPLHSTGTRWEKVAKPWVRED